MMGLNYKGRVGTPQCLEPQFQVTPERQAEPGGSSQQPFVSRVAVWRAAQGRLLSSANKG